MQKFEIMFLYVTLQKLNKIFIGMFDTFFILRYTTTNSLSQHLILRHIEDMRFSVVQTDYNKLLANALTFNKSLRCHSAFNVENFLKHISLHQQLFSAIRM